MSLNRKDVDAIRSNFEYRLGTLTLAGYKIVLGHAKYDPEAGTMEFKVNLNPIAANGEVVDRRSADFKRNCHRYGLDPEDLGKTFYSQGQKFKITGLNGRAHKMPVCADRVSDGKKFKFAASMVQAGLGKKPAPHKPIGPEVFGERYKDDRETQTITNDDVTVVNAAELLGKAKRPDSEIIKDLQLVENGLSPENLHCDGEASASYVRTRSAELLKRKAALTRELGREASPRELWAEST